MCHWCYLVCVIPTRWLLLWTGHCSGVIVSGTVCWLNVNLFNAALLHWGYLLVQFWFDGCWLWITHYVHTFFFTWVLCFYIILDKVCHILHVFGLNSMVCSHIIAVHLSSDQVTYDLGWMMTCIIVTFNCACASVVSSNLQLVLYYTWYCYLY